MVYFCFFFIFISFDFNRENPFRCSVHVVHAISSKNHLFISFKVRAVQSASRYPLRCD